MVKPLVSALIVVMIVAGTAGAEERKTNPWKPLFFASLGLTIAATAFTTVSQLTMKSEAEQIDATKFGNQRITDDDCNDRSVLMGGGDEHFDNACAWRSRTRTGMVLTVGFGVVALATAYLAFSGGDDSAPSNVSIAPTISPDGAGATMRLSW